MRLSTLPKWASSPQLEPDELRKKRTRFALRVAAAYATEEGSLAALANLLNVTPASLHVAVDRGHVGPTTAVRIEQLTDGVVPKELLNDAFLTP